MIDLGTLPDVYRTHHLRFFTEVAHTALANASHALEERLARWLLMCHDRVDGAMSP